MTKRERNNPEWQALITEHQILKRKLQSKSEALLILSKDLDRAQNERDQFKFMAEKLQERCQAYKRQHADFLLTGDKAKLVQLLQDMKNQKTACQRQNEILQQKLNEATGDVKLLREKFARQTIGDEGIGARHFPLHEREKLVTQLEESQQQCDHWRREYESQVEIANEALTDRDGSRDKADRLNQELSRVLTGDKKRIIDVDALCMENKYLQERVSQCLAEKNSLHAQITKYKNILSSKRTSKSASPRSVGLRTADVVISPKHLRDLLSKGSAIQNSNEKITDLQTIVSTLLETINDKNLALHHLRNTNKILGNRVSDLERKLKTFEVAGLWNIQGSIGSFNSEQKSIDLLGPQGSKQYESTNSDETSSASEEENHSIDDDVNHDNVLTDETTLSVTITKEVQHQASEKLLESGDQLGLPLSDDALSNETYSEEKVDAWLKTSVDCDDKNVESDTEMTVSLLDTTNQLDIRDNGYPDAHVDLEMDNISVESDQAANLSEA